jgi:hypothetical protein
MKEAAFRSQGHVRNDREVRHVKGRTDSHNPFNRLHRTAYVTNQTPLPSPLLHVYAYCSQRSSVILNRPSPPICRAPSPAEMDRGSLHRSIHSGVFHPNTSTLSKRHRIRGITRTLVEVAQGMAHLHSSELVHGDLKPGGRAGACPSSWGAGRAAERPSIFLGTRDHVHATRRNAAYLGLMEPAMRG